MALCGVSWSAAGRNYVDVACLAVVASQGAPPGWAAAEARLAELDRVATTMGPGSGGLDALASLIRPPAWTADAACAEHPGLRWFPAHPDNVPAETAAVCDGCLVRSECLAAAIEGEEAGVWAGTSERERRRMRAEAA